MHTRADADPFAADLDAFVEDLRVRRYSPASAKLLKNSLPRLFAFLADQGVRDPRAVNETHLAAFARSLEKAKTRHHQTPLTPMTRRNYLRAVRSFFTFLARRGLLLHNPAAELPLPKPHYLPRRVLTVRQAARLMTAPSPWTHLGQRERAILEVLYGSGIRRGEIVGKALATYGFVITCSDAMEMISLANAFAPEHLEIVTKTPNEIADKITSAGLILIGPFSPVALSDYGSGTNHVLPTSGFGYSFSGLSVLDFVRRVSVVESSKEGLRKIKPNIKVLTEAERLPNHYRAVEARFET